MRSEYEANEALAATMPKRLINAAIAKKASIGSEYDSQGKRIAYWYRAPGSDWKVYRGTVAGMLHVLRFVQTAGDSK